MTHDWYGPIRRQRLEATPMREELDEVNRAFDAMFADQRPFDAIPMPRDPYHQLGEDAE